MSRAQNIHDKNKWKKKKHPDSKCSNTKCMICHPYKVTNEPTRQQKRADDKIKTQLDIWV